MKRTANEIDVMIQKLKDEKERLPRFSAFGTDNWVSSDLMIDVLEGKYPTIDDVYNVENAVGHENSSSMCLAIDWLNGDVEDDEII